VGRLVLQPSTYLDLIYRFRFDRSSLSNRSSEINMVAGPPNLKVNASYLLMPAEQQSDLITVPGSGATILYGKRSQLNFGVNMKLTRYWSVSGSETINLTDSTNIVNGIPTPQADSTNLYTNASLIYQDECMAFITTLTRSAVRNGDVTPGYAVLFSIVFKNIGEIGGNILTVSPPSGS
jgi:LPS-assembly protein